MSSLMEYVENKFREENKDSLVTVGYGEDEYGPYTSFTKSDKYYTPTIEEFHVGFEYEVPQRVVVAQVLSEEQMKDMPSYTMVTKECTLEDLQSLQVDDGTLCGIECKGEVLGTRVKYLDKEDIESLGFTQLPDVLNIFKYKIPYSTSGLEDPNYWLYWHISLLNRSDKYPNVIIHNNQDYDGMEKIFEGTIKNKSELKVLLKQLNLN